LGTVHDDGLDADHRTITDLAAVQHRLVPHADASADAQRVADIFANLKTKVADTKQALAEAAEATRKAGAYASLWLFVSLLSAAFVASLCATAGGIRRDLH